MDIRPVKNETDYDAALAAIEKLWGAASGTPEGDRLDVLLILVAAYESEHHPVPPPSPLDAVRFVMEQKGMSQADLARMIGVSKSKISEVLHGKRPITLSLVKALKRHLGIPADILVAEQCALPDDRNLDWRLFPLKEIVRRGYGARYDPKTQAEEIVRALMAQAGEAPPCDEAVCFRQGLRRSGKDDPHAVQAWLWCVQAAVRGRERVRRTPGVLDADFLNRVARLSILPNGPQVAVDFLLAKGIVLVVVPHFKRTYLDGAALVTADGTPVVALTLRYDRIDYFWFTLLHELAHLALNHVSGDNVRCIVDDLDVSAGDDRERAADAAALDAQIPPDIWKKSGARTARRPEAIRKLAWEQDIHPAIIAGRIRREQQDYRLLSREVGHGEVRKLFPALMVP
jgi:HTH-type transcriptional regulator/antitoxin HigA